MAGGSQLGGGGAGLMEKSKLNMSQVRFLLSLPSNIIS